MLTRTLVSHNFAVMSKKASGRSVLMSLHDGCPSLAKGMTRGTLMTTSVAIGGGVMPFSAHSTFRASNVHLKAPTVAAHNTGRSLVCRVTRVVRAMLSGMSGRRIVTSMHRHMGRAVGGCPVFTCWLGSWGQGGVGGVGSVTVLLDTYLMFDKYNVAGATGNKVVNTKDKTTLKTLVKNVTNRKGKTTVKTTMNTTMNANTNMLVNGGVSGTTTRTRRVRNTRMRRMASGGKLRTMGIAFSSNVLFGADDTALDAPTGSTLDGFTGGILGRGGSVSITVCKCASGAN